MYYTLLQVEFGNNVQAVVFFIDYAFMFKKNSTKKKFKKERTYYLHISTASLLFNSIEIRTTAYWRFASY